MTECISYIRKGLEEFPNKGCMRNSADKEGCGYGKNQGG